MFWAGLWLLARRNHTENFLVSAIIQPDNPLRILWGIPDNNITGATRKCQMTSPGERARIIALFSNLFTSFLSLFLTGPSCYLRDHYISSLNISINLKQRTEFVCAQWLV